MIIDGTTKNVGTLVIIDSKRLVTKLQFWLKKYKKLNTILHENDSLNGELKPESKSL